MKRDVVIVAGGGVVAVLPFLVGDYWIGLATQALIYGAVAAGLDVLVGYAGLPSLGHAAFFGLAGYGTALLTTVSGIDPMVAAGIAVVATVVVAAALAPFVTRLRGLGFITVTLAFGQVVWGMAVRGGSLTGGENGIAAVPRPLLPGDLLATRSGFFWATIVLVVAALLVVSRLTQSSFGLSLLGVRDASRRMTAIGYRVNLRRTIAFIVAAGIGAVFGVWFVFFNQFVGPSTLDWRLSATFLLAVVVGGSASLWGPFLAGATLQVVETTLTGQTSLWPMVLGVLYVFSVLVIPDGVVSIPRKLGRLRADTKATATAELSHAMSEAALDVRGVSVHFDGLVAVDDVTLTIPRGGRHGILGPNGAGKTTLFDAITGFVPITSGSVLLSGTDVTAADAARRARMGLVRTFQITTLMPTLSTFENVMLGSLVNAGEHRSWWRPYRDAEASTAISCDVIDRLGLSHVADLAINELSYGDCRRIELAVALAAEPSVLLLDEPAAGLSVAERQTMVELLSGVPADLTTVVIEHDVEVIFALADTVTVLDQGGVVVTESNAAVKADPRVKEIYLGAG